MAHKSDSSTLLYKVDGAPVLLVQWDGQTPLDRKACVGVLWLQKLQEMVGGVGRSEGNVIGTHRFWFWFWF
jgi:hypothetical protein